MDGEAVMNGWPEAYTARRYLVVLGDSVAEGQNDPDPAGGWIGWAGRLADALGLPRAHVANAARPGATIADVVRDQLPAVRHLRPGLVVINCGMNDALNGFQNADVADRLEEVFGWSRAMGAAAIAAPVPHPPLLDRGLMSEFRKKRVRQRIHEFNDALARSTKASGMTFLSPEAVPRVDHPSLWSADGIHLNSDGHAYVAEVIADIARDLLSERTI
ncbi:SGNH/GDSL hydrolase family protein [Spirillospora sp. NPDC047279]|uniref:SGNH/GDSL hydrolase family protein n=1 Tax=Spirillospora sp. NPDC047279 TaxID=3155478 RepID=UPI0033C0EFCF